MEDYRIFFSSTVDGERTARRCKGDFREADGGFRLRFSDGESEISLAYDGVAMTVVRRAETTGTYVFREGLKTEGKLLSPYGEILVGILTETLSVGKTERGTVIRAAYGAEFGGGTSRCEIMICVAEGT